MSEPFVSYAQNFEDVMLWRALGRLPDGSPRAAPGCWIDVGAWDPVADSVTYAFYRRGWRGLNLEPNPEFFPLLAISRPGDVNLPVAAGERDGSLRFWRIPQSGLSTGDAATAETHRRLGFALEPLDVPVRRLAGLCDEHGFTAVDFLKIDAEGMERAVLAGAGLERLRPRVILIEATKPNSQEPTDGDWRDLLDAAGYGEVYFDGLNRFYLAAEHRADLAGYFAAPPNVFDRFVRFGEETRVNAARSERDAALAVARSAVSEAQAARAELLAMRRSLSWRATQPFRQAAGALRPRRRSG